MTRIRADQLLVTRGLAESRSQAQRLVMAGQVRADGQVVSKPANLLEESVELVVDRGSRYVSRGGEKLAAALERFPVVVAGTICADVGASTGGFTDCLLQAGAARVYAIDVGRGQLHWKLRQDDRVVVMERTNARYIESLPEKVGLVTMDAAFISAGTLALPAAGWLVPGGDMIILLKPQFEAGRKQAAHGQGVIRDPAVHGEVLRRVIPEIEGFGLGLQGLIRSPVLGPKGNIEFLAWFKSGAPQPDDLDRWIQSVVQPDEPRDRLG